MLLSGRIQRNSLLLLILLAAFGCGEKFSNTDSFRFLIPWQNSDGGYSYQEVEVTTLATPYRLAGGAAQIYSNIQLENERVEGDIAQPNLVRTDDSLYVATDPLSLSAVAIYAHFEALQKFDYRLDLRELTWPRRIGVDIDFLDNDGTRIPNNALYIQDYDLVVVTPYYRKELPFFVNGAVLAHEHFHAHFYHLVKKPLYEQLNPGVESDEDRDLHNQTVMRSWNEGLADVWAYLYSNDFDPIGRSLEEYSTGQLAKIRSLNRDFRPLRGLDELKKAWKKETTSPYRVGTNLARFLVSQLKPLETVASTAGQDERIKFAAKLISKLRTFHIYLLSRYPKEYLLPANLLHHLFKGEKGVNGKVCSSLAVILSEDENKSIYKDICALR